MQLPQAMTYTLTKSNPYFKALYNPAHLVLKRISSSHPPAQAVLLQHPIEQPIIVVDERGDVDIIGPPDPVSNLRPVTRFPSKYETKLQCRFREMQDETQAWNQEFWAKHNTKFIKEKQQYIDSHQIAGEEKKQLTADEMSGFYKKFLDQNWQTHLKYNGEWYKKNFTLLFLALRVNIEKCILKFS